MEDTTTAQVETNAGQRRQGWFRVATIAIKRSVAIFCFFLTVYFVTGSIFYGNWWYDFVWTGKGWDPSYRSQGLYFLLDNHPYLILAVIIGLFLFAVAVGVFRTVVFSVVDRLWAWISAGSVIAICATAVLLYRNFNSGHPDEFREKLAANFRKELEIRTKPILKPTIMAPIDFKYLDHVRVETLYSEIVPELIEQERSIETETKKGGKASVSVGGVSGEVSTDRATQTKSVFNRTEFSPSRKCIELMNFTIQNDRARVYSSADLWFVKRLSKDFADRFERNLTEPITRQNLENLRLRRYDEPPSPEEEAESRLKAAQFEAEFNNEMSSLTGLVFIEGEFQLAGNTAEQQAITHEFAKAPKQIRFRITLPASSHLDQAAKDHKIWLRVFAWTDRGLDDSGIIPMHAIAVF